MYQIILTDFIGGGDFLKNSLPDTRPIDRDYYVSPVKIGKNTWIGEGVVIMPGVIIGEGCVIGANSVVTKQIYKHSMAVGVPAKIIKRFDDNTKEWVAVK